MTVQDKRKQVWNKFLPGILIEVAVSFYGIFMGLLWPTVLGILFLAFLLLVVHLKVSKVEKDGDDQPQ